MTVSIFCSTTTDGSMKSSDGSYVSVLKTRTSFLQKHSITPEDTTLVQMVYAGDNYTRYRTLLAKDRGEGITYSPTAANDGLVTTESDHALFLPIADCIGAVLHDPIKNILMVSHLGRHNLEQFGGTKSVEYLVEEHGVDPKNLTVWLSPAAGSEHYPLFAFENRSMHDIAVEQLLKAGVVSQNITSSLIDTTKDESYYSHSEFLKGNRIDDGRFAIVAMMI